jgi:hypothetical protein
LDFRGTHTPALQKLPPLHWESAVHAEGQEAEPPHT